MSAGHALADTSVFIGLEKARFDEGEMPASVTGGRLNTRLPA